jgi:ABC-type glycerol-3-phosphate transport system substrate-binding protein
MRKMLAMGMIAVLALAVAFAAIGCGGKKAEESSTTTTTTTTTTTEAGGMDTTMHMDSTTAK